MPKYARAVCAGMILCALGGLIAAAQQLRQAKGPRMSENGFNLPPIETQVLGQSRWLRGGPAALRVIVMNHDTGRPVRAAVTIALASAQDKSHAPVTLFSGNTSSLGTLNARFTVPALLPGAYDLRVGVKSSIGNDEVIQPIRVERAEQILLTSDKPVYQPGQVMHLRALALDVANRRAVADQPITFEVEDARGNKVFKQKEALSRFGVAAVDFTLADEVNMGVYTLRAILSDSRAEKKVRVERYVLPKFKVTVSTDRPYYQPGDTVKGTVQADYFFGKPVSHGQVTVTVRTVDIGVTKLAELTGTTDGSGTYTFEYTLPASFIGQPFEQGKAVAEFEVHVKDTADHIQMQSKTVPVVKDPISIVMVPERRELAPGLPNRIYIACGTPDGAPLKGGSVTVTSTAQPNPVHLTTDALGIATYSFVPSGPGVQVTVTASAPDGHTAKAVQQFSVTPSREAVLLRTDKTLAKVGDRLDLTVLSSVKGGTIYLDVIRNKQTILTSAQSAKDGKAEFSLPLTNDMVGTLEIHAYKILPNEDIVRDTRAVVVSPAEDLKIRVVTDKPEYRPGAEALLQFAVTDPANQPVQAAIGLAVVDESVFALSELQPGLEKVYFTLERELMEPRYEIHGLKPTDLVLHPREQGATEAERQRAAALLLASLPAGPEFDYRIDTYQQRWDAVRSRVEEVMAKAYQRIRNAAQKFRADTGAPLTERQGIQTLVDRGYLTERDTRDPWNYPYRITLHGRGDFDSWFEITTAGPDGRFGTADDITWSPYVSRAVLLDRARGGFGGRFLAEEGVPGPMLMKAMAAGAEFRGAMGAAPALANGAPGAAPAPEPRVRQYFPETMYWNPAIITDERGRAEVRVPVADSITTWRMSMLANSALGQLGSATAPLKVFQDFFVDLDLPVSLTQNDRVEIPVAVYNYLPSEQDVTLTLEEQPWFRLEGEARRTLHIAKNEVRVIHFPITVVALGRHTLKVTARGSRLSDAVLRSIEVTPDGKEMRSAVNDRLEGKVRKTVVFPANAIAGASGLWVKLYPGPFSQVVEGLDGLLRMPFGCFEQTSSVTYPNVLVTDYLKATKRINPELQMKAEGFINIGYQRLVTFEVKGGGFSWFGEAPANQILTAYGLLEFSDMARVHDVDPALISRTQRWLAGRQKPDGTWPPDQGGIAEGIINRQTNALRSAAYIAWALAESGYKGPEVAKAVEYVKTNRGEAKDAYTLALILNLLTKTERDSAFTDGVAQQLIGMAKQTEKTAWWEGEERTFTGATRASADMETTGLAAYGLAKWGRNAGFVNKVLTYLVQSKDSFGTWSTTQGTVWAMKALLYASTQGAGGVKGTVTVWANGVKVTSFQITPENNDVMRQIDLKDQMKGDRNEIELAFEGEGSLLYQIASRYYIPWKDSAERPEGKGPLSIEVAYDKTTLAQDDTARVTVRVHNNTNRIAEMPLIDLGVPPGFDVLVEDLETAVRQKTINKYTLAQRQIIVYLEKLDPGATLELHYAVKAKYPIRAKTPLSKAYPYYNPEEASVSPPQMLVVRK
ncbi:MAG: MG2 domain-containing protein [Chthonomonadales bacterium]